MRIALAQNNYTIGAFEENAEKIISSINKAKLEKADLVVFSELSVCGYPPHDLLEHKAFVDKVQKSISEIAEATQGIAVIVGAPVINEKPKGKNLFNSALFIQDKKVKCIVNKTLLPTYDIFDEYRYFEPGDFFEVISYKGKKMALTICEDLWYQQPLLTNFGKNKMYSLNPIAELKKQNPDFIINIAASPFAYNHDSIKSEILQMNATKFDLPIVYVNQVGAHTELVFDGGSRVISASGKVVSRMLSFEEDFLVFDLNTIADTKNETEATKDFRIGHIHDALVLGVRDYFSKMGFHTATLGLSGGIDSAVTLAIAEKALGADNLRVLLLPSKYSSDHSVTDAIALAKNLGVQYEIVSIESIVEAYDKSLAPIFKDLQADIAEENIQARIRGTLLMAISNKFGNILLNTSNKSEAAVGYSTLYGDMNGGLSVLGDVYKSDVFKLASFINRHSEIIPVNTITKPPSAELRPDQKDTDSLPDYDILDAILYAYIELRKSQEEIIDEGYDKEIVKRAIRLVNMNEYKRFQTPPILRVSSKAFGFGRRMPLVAKY